MKKTILFLVLILVQLLLFAQNEGFEPVVISIDGEQTKLYDESHALVLGMSDYTAGRPDLQGVKNDVEAVENVLKQIGLHVVVKENLTKEGTDQAFVDFISEYGQDCWHDMGKLLKADKAWKERNGIDAWGFNALPGGYCLFFEGEATYFHEGSDAGFWTSTTKNTTLAWARGMSIRNDDLNRIYIDGKSWAFSVRCIKE